MQTLNILSKELLLYCCEIWSVKVEHEVKCKYWQQKTSKRVVCSEWHFYSSSSGSWE